MSKLQTFQVLVEETLARTVEVKSTDADTARALVSAQYADEVIVLDSSDLQEHSIYVLGEDL